MPRAAVLMIVAAGPLAAQDARPPAAAALLAEAHALYQQGRLDDAERAARGLLAAHPRLAPAHVLLGHILFRQVQAKASPDAGGGHSEAARAGARASLQAFAEGARHGRVGAVDMKVAALDHVLLGDLVSADRSLTLSVEMDPKNTEAWYYLGRTKYNENRFEEAVAAFQRSLELRPRDVKAQDNLGLAYAGLGRAEQARAAYLQAIAWQAALPDKSPGPYLDLGSLLLEQGRAGEALPYLVQAAQLAPGDARPHEQLGKAHLQMDAPGQAQAELEQAAALAPERAPVHFLLGQAYRRAGQLDKARAALERAAALNARGREPQASPREP